MRKITLIVALIGLSIAANAQSVKLQSAISDLRNGRLNKAKANIDAAAEHEDTKNDPKTWIYRGLIYCQLGAPDVKDKYKGLCDNCFEVAYEAALRCKELDQTNEYKELNNSVFQAVGAAYYNSTVDLYTAASKNNDTNLYRQAMRKAEEVIKIGNNTGDKKSASDAYWIAGLSAEMLKDVAAIEKYYKVLVRQKTDKERVLKRVFEELNFEQDKYLKSFKNAISNACRCCTVRNILFLFCTVYSKHFIPLTLASRKDRCCKFIKNRFTVRGAFITFTNFKRRANRKGETVFSSIKSTYRHNR